MHRGMLLMLQQEREVKARAHRTTGSKLALISSREYIHISFSTSNRFPSVVFKTDSGPFTSMFHRVTPQPTDQHYLEPPSCQQQTYPYLLNQVNSRNYSFQVSLEYVFFNLLVSLIYGS